MTIHKRYCAVCLTRLELAGSVCGSDECKSKLHADLVAKYGPPQGDILANWKRFGSKRYPRWERIDYKDLPEKTDDPERYEPWEGAFVRKSARADAPKPWFAYYQTGRPGDIGYVHSKRAYKTEKEALVETDKAFPISTPVKRYLYKLAEIDAVNPATAIALKKFVKQVEQKIVLSGPAVGRLYPSVEQNKPSESEPRAIPYGLNLNEKETRWGVWYVGDPILKSLIPTWCVLNPETIGVCEKDPPHAGTIEDAKKAHAWYMARFSSGAYQIREYISEDVPGQMWLKPPQSPPIEVGSVIPAVLEWGLPSTERMAAGLNKTYELKWKSPGTVSMQLLNGVLHAKCTCGYEEIRNLDCGHVQVWGKCRCGAEWTWAGVVEAPKVEPKTAKSDNPLIEFLRKIKSAKFECPATPEKLTDWSRVYVRRSLKGEDICDYERVVPERNLRLYVQCVGGTGWMTYFAYNGAEPQWSGHMFVSLWAAMEFCEERENVR